MASRSHTPKHAASPEKRRPAGRTAAVLATTVGTAAAVSTALASPANAAAHHTVWDRVAKCESGNNWHINTGNGFYGGLQFSAGTWRAYGGHKYAHQASRATRPEQIEVARRVLKSQGSGAWPVCGPQAGLTRSNGKATSTRLPAKAGSPDKPAHHSAKKHHKKKHHHKTKHHKTRHANHGTYLVRSGDTLSAIARSHHVHGGWHALYRANRKHLSSPNVLRVGQHLTLP
ncbi:transglycosylase family protein [uncultured Jatrophihabitans sp.]|uniref:transglycosylase family protein n=1 Tax=uncultured Jatrophihabitans sp. TaxID=1610747 RepID=UPI0035C95310